MRYYLICTFLFGMFSQSYSSNYNPDSLYFNKKYFEAAIAYERAIYQSEDYKEKNLLMYKKALCYKAMGKHEKAKNNLLKISMFGLKKEVQNSILYESALTSYLSGDYEQCERILLTTNIEHLSKYERKKNLQLIAVFNNIMLQKFDASKQEAIKYVKLTAPKDSIEIYKQTIECLYSKRNLPKIRNLKLFEWISIIPGLGQMVAGKPGEGIANIALNLSAFSFGVYQILNGFYLTGYFVGTLSINKFYFGGRTRAKNLVIQHNDNEILEFHNKIKNNL